jgi:transcriptional regulator with XRE-family HTH domain
MDRGSEYSAAGSRISQTVRALRQERGWTQAELAKKLGLSQSRLSEIERGAGSFSAEQFLLILRLFNVTTSRFTGKTGDRGAQLQNALARFGASHLRESAAAAPADDLVDPVAATREVLVGGDPRLITALTPVLIEHADHIGLGNLYLDLERIGLERRLPWICENSSAAVDPDFLKEASRTWAQRARRAVVVLNAFVESLSRGSDAQRAPSLPPDTIDPNIRSKKTFEEVKAAASSISKRWGIVSALQPGDFAQALRAARAAHP